MLNKIRFFIVPDVDMNEYMLKCYETMACSCVLCSYNQGKSEDKALGFHDMENVVLFRDVTELLGKLKVLREYPNLTDRIASADQSLAESEYTFKKLVKES